MNGNKNKTLGKLGKTHIKEMVFLVVGPLRGGGRGGPVTPPSTKQKKHFFSINGENSPGSCIMKILFCEIRHFSPNFHKCTPNFVCVYFYWYENNICQKKNLTFLAQKKTKKKKKKK